MELKEGMYVRTESGLIAKYIGFEKDEEDDEYSKYNFNGKIYWYYEYYNDYVYEEDFEEWFESSVVKASNNIIDLIEAGDYVNGCYVLEKDSKFIVVNGLDNYGFGQGVIPIEDIKSIVTKEQFESMSYKVSK